MLVLLSVQVLSTDAQCIDVVTNATYDWFIKITKLFSQVFRNQRFLSYVLNLEPTSVYTKPTFVCLFVYLVVAV